jgi:prepilin peptidase CpaA
MWYYIKISEVLILLLFAVYFDREYFKIKNEIVLAGLVAGVLTNLLNEGVKGILDSMLGIVLPIILLFILFALKMLGAGDLKLFAAVGAITGFKFILYSMAVSMLFAGVLAVIIIAFRKNAAHRFKHLFNYLKLCLLTLKLHEYQEFNSEDKGQFRFSYAVAGGTVIALIVYRHMMQ